MSNGSNFVSSSSFALPDEILRQLKASDFISGTSTGPERTKALVEGALDPPCSFGFKQGNAVKAVCTGTGRIRFTGKNLASMEEFRTGVLALQDRRLDELRKQRKSELFSGLGQLAGLALFMPGGKSTTTTVGNVATTVTPTLGTKTWEVAKKAWNFIFP